MEVVTNLQASLVENWHVWLLSTVMVVAAVMAMTVVVVVIRLVHVRSTSLHLRCAMSDRNSCSLRTTYRTPSITPLSPIRARGVATIVNAPRPPRGFGILITLISCRRFAPFVRTFETLVPPDSVTRRYRFAGLGVVERFFVGVDDDAVGGFLFLSMILLLSETWQ